MSRRLIVFVFLVFAVLTTRAAEELNPPFGFRWNDPMSRVEAVLKGAKATIVSREKKENREVWTIEGLVHPGLKRTLFTFKAGALFGVELQYEYPDWSIERYNERMGEIRRYFDAKYGTGKLVSRTRDTDSADTAPLSGSRRRGACGRGTCGPRRPCAARSRRAGRFREGLSEGF